MFCTTFCGMRSSISTADRTAKPMKARTLTEGVIKSVTCGEVRDWGGIVSFKTKFASTGIEWSTLLAE